MLRRSFQPILIAARFPWRCYTPGDVFRAEVWLVNDGPSSWQECCAEVLFDATTVWALTDVELLPGCASRIGELSVVLSNVPQILTLHLRCAEITLAANRYDMAVYLPGRQPRRARQIHALGEHLLE